MTEVVILPPPLDLTVYGGDDVQIGITFRQDGDPLTLVSPFLAQIRSAADANAISGTLSFVAEGDQGSGTLHISGDTTQALLSLPGSQTVQFQQNGSTYQQKQYSGVWDLQMGPSGAVKTIAAGAFIVQGDVSRVS